MKLGNCLWVWGALALVLVGLRTLGAQHPRDRESKGQAPDDGGRRPRWLAQLPLGLRSRVVSAQKASTAQHLKPSEDQPPQDMVALVPSRSRAQGESHVTDHVSKRNAWRSAPHQDSGTGVERGDKALRWRQAWGSMLASARVGLMAQDKLLVEPRLTDPSGPQALSPSAEVLSAALRGDMQVLSEVLALEPECRNSLNSAGETPLMLAAVGGGAEAVTLLLSRGTDVQAMDVHGWTALMKAVAVGDIEAVKRLLAAGADRFVRNKAGARALDIATSWGKTAIAELLDPSSPYPPEGQESEDSTARCSDPQGIAEKLDAQAKEMRELRAEVLEIKKEQARLAQQVASARESASESLAEVLQDMKETQVDTRQILEEYHRKLSVFTTMDAGASNQVVPVVRIDKQDSEEPGGRCPRPRALGPSESFGTNELTPDACDDNAMEAKRMEEERLGRQLLGEAEASVLQPLLPSGPQPSAPAEPAKSAEAESGFEDWGSVADKLGLRKSPEAPGLRQTVKDEENTPELRNNPGGEEALREEIRGKGLRGSRTPP